VKVARALNAEEQSLMHAIFPYLEHEYFSCRPVDVKLAVGGIVWVDTLASEEVDDLLGTILVSVRGGHLRMVNIDAS
jgi:hypothetical protein